jgi:hypothetical protein
MRKTSVAVAMAAVLRVFSVEAQGPSEAWKKNHAVDQRYEGVGFQRNVTTFGLNLISFLAVTNPDTRAAVDISQHDDIGVEFYSHVRGPYLLTARELDLFEYYWMEPKVKPVADEGPNTFQGIWKTDVLRDLKSKKSRLSVDGLGVRIWFKKEDDIEHVAPAIVRASNAPRPQEITAYIATFLPDVMFDRVSFSVRAGCLRSDTSAPFPGGGSVGRQRAGTSFPVNFTIPAGKSGPMLLEITTTRFIPSEPKPKIEKSWYCFAHPGASR